MRKKGRDDIFLIGDSELSQEQKRALDSRLETSSEDKEGLQYLKELQSDLKTLEDPVKSEAFVRSVMKKLPRGKILSDKWNVIQEFIAAKQWAYSAVAVLLLVLIVEPNINSQTSSTPPEALLLSAIEGEMLFYTQDDELDSNIDALFYEYTNEI